MASESESETGTIVITGASGGIGSAAARALSTTGHRLLLHGNRGVERLAGLATELRSGGCRVDTITAELSERRDRELFLQAIRATLAGSRLFGFVHAAGVDLMALSKEGRTWDEKREALFAVDVAAGMHLSRSLGALMAGQTGNGVAATGGIILFGWEAAERGMAGETAELYAAAKGAVTAFARSLAQSLAPHVRVNCVLPGWIQTTWGKTASDKSNERAVQDSLAGRWGTAEEVGRVVRFLLSDESSFVNATTLSVAGGYRSR